MLLGSFDNIKSFHVSNQNLPVVMLMFLLFMSQSVAEGLEPTKMYLIPGETGTMGNSVNFIDKYQENLIK